jgi:plastocyanin
MDKHGVIARVALLTGALLTLPATASAVTRVVYAGAPPRAKTRALVVKLLGKKALAIKADNAAFLAFQSKTVTINQGGSVEWLGLQQFHTVDFPAKGGADLPLFVHSKTVAGVNDFAGNPFWFDGTEPSAEFNSRLNGPIGGKTYNGSSRVDSGASGPKAFTLTFTKPGVYKYYCDVHPGMIGYVIVKAKGTPIPSARQAAAALTKQLTNEILSAPKLLQSSTHVPANTVDLGVGADGLALYHFFPATLNVKAGTVVTFRVPPGEQTEGHTASFGPTAYLTALSKSSSDAATQETAYPSSNPADGPIQLSPSSHGNGFASTGTLNQDPSGFFPTSEKIQFTTPGTYHFYCLIHPFMSGTIVVH